MRTTGGINMSPLDILDVAQAYDRLYDIEKATMFNNMKRLSENPLAFSGHKLFLNTIPGHFLKADDYDLFMDTYHDYFGQLVFEITEQDTITDDELNFIKLLSDDNGAVQIAVDDYGTGHSNIVNLLRYAPQVLKIDRFLISGINSDTNKQKAVKTTIEFARLNDIKVHRNKNGLDIKKLKPGTVIAYFKGSKYIHTALVVEGGKIADCTSGRKDNIKYGIAPYTKWTIKLAFEYTGK